MERDTLSFSQWMALLLGALLGPAIELLPGSAAQAGIVGAALSAVGIALFGAAGILVGYLASDGGLLRAIGKSFGSWGGKAVLLLYLIWGELLLALRLRLAAQRMMDGGERDGAVWFFIVVLAVLAWWMGKGSLGALGRTAQLFFLGLAVAGAAVLAVSLFQVEPGNLLTSWKDAGATELVWPGIQVAGYGSFAMFLYQPSGKKDGRSWLRALVWAWFVVTVAQIIIVGRFGPALTQELESPFLQLAKSIGVKGAFQRVESIVGALWMFSDLLLLALLLCGVKRIGTEIITKGSELALTTVQIVVAVVLAVACFGVKISAKEVEDQLIPVGNIILGIVVPAFACILLRRKGKNR